MTEIPKHEHSKKTKGSKKKQVVPMIDVDHGPFVDMSGIAEEIAHFTRIFDTWVSRQLAGDNGQPLFTEKGGYPVKVALTSLDGEDEALPSLEIDFTGPVVHSIADSLKRIADAMTQQKDT